MTKKQFNFWLKEIDRELLHLGGEKFIYREQTEGCQAPQLWGYRFQTKYGEYICHVDIPWHVDSKDRSRLRYNMAVYGKFTNGNSEITKNPSGKWNFHYGDDCGEDNEGILYVVGAICNKISNILLENER